MINAVCPYDAAFMLCEIREGLHLLRETVKKAALFMKTLCLFCKFKILYGKRMDIRLVNSVRGKLKIDLSEKSRCTIGDFFMCTGPAYLKCTGESRLYIGKRLFMNHNCSITCTEQIEIGDDCNIANNVVIVDHDHIMTPEGVLGTTVSSPIKIGNKVWIGANAVILKGITIGDGAVIAAGAVVNKDIPSHEVWGEVPAKFIRKL